MPHASPWWAPDIHADRQPFLRARRAILAALRRHLEAEGFIEVETAILQFSPGNEAHLHAFATELETPDGRRKNLYLHTSPEFACKKLLAAGERQIFEFARVFRNRERGALHHPEFTMLEWYRANAPYDVVMADCAAMLAVAAAAIESKVFSFRGRRADPFATPERLTVASAFALHAGIDLFAALDDTDGFAAQARAVGVRLAADDSWSDIFSRVLVERVEPELGNGRATILTEYPRSEAALACANPHDPRFAERFELFVAGVEIANGFGELIDPLEQRARLEAEMNKKMRLYGEQYPLDEEFLSALGSMPPASGCALGFDRLVMLATAATSIDRVIWTPLK
jgi:lysyl-tRNA synthetase class 2